MSRFLKFKILLNYPSTVLHEFCHFIFAFIFGNVISVSIVPKIKDKRIILGSVYFSSSISFFHVLIAIAPILNLVVFYYILKHFNFDYNNFLLIDFKEKIFYVIVSLIFINAAILSKEDVQIIKNNLFSFSTFIFLYLIIYYSNKYNLINLNNLYNQFLILFK